MATVTLSTSWQRLEVLAGPTHSHDERSDKVSFAAQPMHVPFRIFGCAAPASQQGVRAASAGCSSAQLPFGQGLGLQRDGQLGKPLYTLDESQVRRLPRSADVQRLGSSRSRHGRDGRFVAQSMEAIEEALFGEDTGTRDWNVSGFRGDMPPSLPLQQPIPLPPKNRADDLSLMNPLKRLERMGCGWLSVVLEWEGVIVEDDSQLERKAWSALAEEEKRPQPPAFMLQRAEGMKNEQVISEVLCWTRDFVNVRRLARRKEELYEEMQGGMYRMRPGSKEFVETLRRFKVPVAVASTRPRVYLERAIEAVGMEGYFDVVVAAEDAYRGKPDPEMYQYAAQLLGFIAERCIVVGNSNKTIEAAHDALMKVVAVVGLHPAYELGAADLVVRRLDELSLVDLKNLSDIDSPEFQPPEFNDDFGPEPQMEEEEAVVLPKLAFKDDDMW